MTSWEINEQLPEILGERLGGLPSGLASRSDALATGVRLRAPGRDEADLAADVLTQIAREEGIRGDSQDADNLDAIVRGICGARSDATTGFALEGVTQYAGGRIFDPRTRMYGAVDLIPVVAIPAGTEAYTKRFREVTVQWQRYQSGDTVQTSGQGKVDESAARYIPSFSASYAVGKDWLGTMLQNARTNHIGAGQLENAARRGARRLSHQIHITGAIQAASVYSLKTCPAGLHEEGTVIYGSDTYANVTSDLVARAQLFVESQDGYTASLDAENPAGDGRYLCMMSSRIVNRLLNTQTTNGEKNAWEFCSSALEDMGFTVIKVGRDFRALAGQSSGGNDLDRIEFHDLGDPEASMARVSCLEPTIVDTYTERNRRIVQWGYRPGGLDIVRPSTRHVHDIPVTDSSADILPSEG